MATPNVVNSSSSKILDCTDTIMLCAPLQSCLQSGHWIALTHAICSNTLAYDGTLSPAKNIT